MEQLLQEIFREEGLLGLLLGFLILGPGYTFFRTRALRVRMECHAQELLNRYMAEEIKNGEKLEARLGQTFRRLDEAKSKIFALTLKLTNAEHQLEDMRDLRDEVERLRARVTELEARSTALKQENRDLHKQVEAKDERIQALEEDNTLLDPETEMKGQ